MSAPDSLLVRDGAGNPRTLAPALLVYLWDKDGPLDGARDARDELLALRPEIVVIHDSPSKLLAQAREAVRIVRETLPGVRIGLGIGADGTVDDWRLGRASADDVVRPLVRIAALAQDLGAELAIWNCEAGWKDSAADHRSEAEIEALADRCGREVRAAAPSVVHGLSTYDQPNYHAAMKPLLKGWVKHCSLFTGQSYVAVPGEPPRGALPKRLAAGDKAQGLIARLGWIPADELIADVPTDTDRVPTLQGHKTHKLDLAAAVATLRHLLLWSVPSVPEGGRVDAAGLEAIRVGMQIRAEVGPGPQAVRAYQTRHGLAADGALGPITYAHALARTRTP
jgi:hypothetical protein